jgi:hypothetical protein
MKSPREGGFAFDETVLERLHTEIENKAEELATAIKTQVATGNSKLPGERVRVLTGELRKLRAEFLRYERAAYREFGISASDFRAIERALGEKRLPPTDHRLWRLQVEQAPSNEDLDDILRRGLDRLLSRVNPDWLRREAKKPYRLGSDFLTNPLHLVNGDYVGMNLNADVPQRFARMLLISQDHMMKRWDLDFFSAAMFVAAERFCAARDRVKVSLVGFVPRNL